MINVLRRENKLSIKKYRSIRIVLKCWYIYDSYTNCKGDEKIPENKRDWNMIYANWRSWRTVGMNLKV